MKILRWKEVHEKVRLSRTTVWRFERQGLFPRRIQIGPNSVGWVDTHIDEWVMSRPVAA